MHWSPFLAVVYLFATLVSAISPTTPAADCASKSCNGCIPLQDSDIPKDLAPTSQSSKVNTASKGTTEAEKPEAVKRDLSARNIDDGWFSSEECNDLLRISQQGVAFVNLIDTLWIVRNILAKHGVKWAIGGGLALRTHGMFRYTTDVDIIVDAPMEKVKEMFVGDEMFVVPGSYWPADIPHLRVFYEYRKHRGGNSPRTPKYVEIDIIISGKPFRTSWYRRH